MGIYIQYIYITKIVVFVSEPVRGRSRATELPCFNTGRLIFACMFQNCSEIIVNSVGMTVYLHGSIFVYMCGECFKKKFMLYYP